MYRRVHPAIGSLTSPKEPALIPQSREKGATQHSPGQHPGTIERRLAQALKGRSTEPANRL